MNGSSALRLRVLNLYKTFLYYGRDWPDGYLVFRDKAKAAFSKKKELSDPRDIKRAIKRGEYVLTEIEALYKLKKYRAMKKRYEDVD